MSEIHHPIRDAEIRTYQGDDEAVAILEGFAAPFFRGPTRFDALVKAETFVQGVLDQHEATFIARQEAAAKARASAKAKKAVSA
ncbi:hypothetical protein [Aurantimonas coralicida]|uniref:hypothetical protein n=1 Tax=Aurantimonas coralicida TaxID=182270 RepID=UPI001E43CA5C|nr:hypothetical protein [Aurantimonas coralicida]MCD1645200.1 hypothetical protein [Aurantimonas coralicida]